MFMVSRAILAAGSMLAIISATPALAGTEAAAPAKAPDQNAATGNKSVQDQQQEPAIVVTAQLREQKQIDVPFALTAYTGRQLDQLGVQEFEDLARYTPGLQVQNQSPNNPAINIRGITSDSGDAFFEPRISIIRTAFRSRSRAAPMSSCSISTAWKSPRGRSRRSTAAAR